MRRALLIPLAFFFLLFVRSVQWCVEIMRYPFDSEGNYYDPILSISYHNGIFFSTLFPLILAVSALMGFLFCLYLYKWARLRSKKS